MSAYSYCPSGKQLASWYGNSTQMEFDDKMEPTSADHGDVLYTIGKSDTIGRYMVAKRDILPGEVIFTDEPAVIGPDNSAIPMCTVCWRKATGAYKCPDCGWPLCGTKCRETKEHQRECRFFVERGTKVDITGFGKVNKIYDAILTFRILLLKLINRRVYRLVTLLMDHQENQTQQHTNRIKRISDIIRNSWGFSRDFTVSEVKHVMGILNVNSFVVHDGSEEGMDLIGLYPWTSLLSHACVPNVKIITRDDFSYVCEATVPIKAGTEILTSYHHYYFHLFGTMYRRSDIKYTWSFDCICERCGDPTEKGTYVSGVNCDKCKYSYLLPISPMNYESDWKCIECKNIETNQTITEKLDKFEADMEAIGNKQPEQLELLLRRMRYSLHENHYLITDIKRKIIDIYGHEKGYENSKLSKDVLERKADYCDHLLSLASRLSPGQSEMRGYLLWERHSCHLRLAQWDWLRMKCTTIQYMNSLRAVTESLREIIAILGPIRVDSVEGGNGLKAKKELEELTQQLATLEKQSDYSKDSSLSFRPNRTETRFNRRSFAL